MIVYCAGAVTATLPVGANASAVLVDLTTGGCAVSASAALLPAPSTVEVKGRPNAACPPREIMVPQAQEPARATLAEARALYRIAERCLKNGDLDMARTCYEETHLLAPESSLGREAIQRLADIERPRTSGEGTGEAQEPREVPQDAGYRDMLRKTVPLGR